MMQQINLYQPIFRKQKKVFSALAMIQITGFFIVVLGGIYAYNIIQLEPVISELENSNAQFIKLTEKITLLEKKFPKVVKSKLLENEVKKLTAELEQKVRLKKALSEGSFGNTEGFSSYFVALAREHVNGTWLTGIKISQGGSQLGFSGLSIDPEFVPVYIKKLSSDSIFSNRAFNTLVLEKVDTDQDLISFNVGTGN